MMIDEQGTRAQTTEIEAASLLLERWGLIASMTEIGSLGDQVFEGALQDGGRVALKVYAIGQDTEALDAERAAVEQLKAAFPELALPLDINPLDDQLVRVHGRIARVVEWVNGETLGKAAYLTPDTIVELGRTAGRCTAGLATFGHPGLARESPWDLKSALSTLAEARGELPDSVSPLVDQALAVLHVSKQRLDLDQLPQQAVHCDVTDWNVLGSKRADSSFAITGIIDFGDMVWTWRACEIVAAAHAAIAREPHDPLGALLSALSGYREIVSMTETEAECLWHLMLRRAAVCAALESIEHASDPTNGYVAHLATMDVAALQAMLAIHPAHAAAVVRVALGYGPTRVDLATALAASPITPMIAPAAQTSVSSVWGETEYSDGPEALHPHPQALQTFIRLKAPTGTPVVAPLDAVVLKARIGEAVLSLSCGNESLVLTLQGMDHQLTIGGHISRGEILGTVQGAPAAQNGELLVHAAAEENLPLNGAVRDKAALAAICPDPSPLLGIVAREHQTIDAAAVRKKYVAPSQSLYYAEPAQIVRGRGQWLWDRHGQRLLDVVNNVASVGHAHPRITEAAVDQLTLHNTNSRFLYDATAEFAELVAGTLPEELQSLFFVNSGSEAVDLALQLARTFTARPDVVVLEGTYHGWTSEVFELCTMPADRPDWQQTLSPRVRVAPTPDPYRGQFGDNAEAYLDALREVIGSAESPSNIAAFISEPLFGSHGGVTPADGYLRAAYKEIRATGAVCIADEIQVGYGRTGQTFWAFEAEGVVPDIVVAAKAVGNGHPIGFVACKPEIADVFARTRAFFSSSGGGPVSCRIGSAVLNIIREENLQENAQVVGRHIKQGLTALAMKHSAIGAVHGRGLYMGIDLVAAQGSTAPMPEAEVMAICERLRRLGVITQPTGIHLNVLKVKPPLCITTEDADYFIQQLDRTLADLGQPPLTSPLAALQESTE